MLNRLLFVIAFSGPFAFVIADIIGILVVDSHDPIANTVSQLAIGDHAWIQDLGLKILGLSLISIAVLIAMASKKLGVFNARLKTACLLFVPLIVVIFLIAEHHQYAGRPWKTGMDIHTQCVAAFAVLLASIMFLVFPLTNKLDAAQKFNQIVLLCWVVTAPIFFFVPDNWNGLYERMIFMLPISWQLVMSWTLYKASS